MPTLALVLAAIAFALALLAWLKAGAQTAAVEELRSDLRRNTSNLSEEIEGELQRLRSLLAQVAEGEITSGEQILSGQLWQDASPGDGLALFERGGLRVLDVRTPQETAGGTIPGALLIPVDQLEGRLEELPNDGRTTLVTCAMGGRSAAACEFLSSKGYSALVNLEGGMGAWTGPVEKPS